MSNKTKIILTAAAIVGAVAIVFSAGFMSARRIYKVDNVDEQVAKLSAQLNEATSKLNDMQTKYDEMIALNETMTKQTESLQLNISQALQLCEKSQSTVGEIKSLSDNAAAGASDMRLMIQQLIRNNEVIKNKVVVLERDLADLKAKIMYVPERHAWRLLCGESNGRSI